MLLLLEIALAFLDHIITQDQSVHARAQEAIEGLRRLMHNGFILVEYGLQRSPCGPPLTGSDRCVTTLDGGCLCVRCGCYWRRGITALLSRGCDRSGAGTCFHSALLPPYICHSQSLEALLPWLYLKGVSPGDFAEAFQTSLD